MRLLKCTCDDKLEICDCENANDIFVKTKRLEKIDVRIL